MNSTLAARHALPPRATALLSFGLARSGACPAIPIGFVLAASLFNMVLCFANTHGVHIALAIVIASEMLIVALALTFVWREWLSLALVGTLLTLGWFGAVLLINPAVSPKLLVELGLTTIFYMLGRRYGSPTSGDRLVLILGGLVLAVWLFEWFAFAQYQKLFNVFEYYVNKGALTESHLHDTGTTLGENGMRPGERQLLPGLGQHRLGSIFIEPIALGNFAVIVVTWLAARAKVDRFAGVLATTALTLAVLADDRFAIMAGLAVATVVASGIWRWRWVAACLPFMSLALLLVFAANATHLHYDNTIGGRLYGSGIFMLLQTPLQWLALEPSQVMLDSGFSYLIDTVGLLVPACIWLAFATSRPANQRDARFRLGIAVYLSLSLCISVSSTSIKTSALLWCLAGFLAAPIIRNGVRQDRSWKTMMRIA